MPEVASASGAGMAGGRQALLRQEANAIFPGGIAGPDAGAHGDGRPAPVLDAGKGARVRDMDGTWYVDYAGGNGSAILGHGHPDVLDAVREAAFAGLAPGGLLPLELELAHRLRAAVPVMELLRFAGTGAEAVAGAVRLARAATGRELVVRIAGGRRAAPKAWRQSPGRVSWVRVCRTRRVSPPGPRATRS